MGGHPAFSCLLDGLTVPEEAQVTVTGSCGTARLIRSGGAAAIGVELTLSLLVRTYETVTVAPVTDLYSTRWDTALQRQSLTLTETWPPETVQPEVHQELESRPLPVCDGGGLRRRHHRARRGIIPPSAPPCGCGCCIWMNPAHRLRRSAPTRPPPPCLGM